MTLHPLGVPNSCRWSSRYHLLFFHKKSVVTKAYNVNKKDFKELSKKLSVPSVPLVAHVHDAWYTTLCLS